MSNKKTPIKIGLTVEEMLAVALAEFAAKSAELTTEAFEENLHDSKTLKASLVIANEEAMLHTVALMIERNNQVLLEHLKQLGVAQDQ